MEEYWKSLGNQLTKIDNYYHSKESNLTIKQRLEGIHKEFQKVLNDNAGNIKAIEYTQRRKELDINLEQIQHAIKKEAIELLNNESIYPVSSFTARTNLIGESDLDFAVLVDKLSEEVIKKYTKLFESNGYTFTEIRHAKTIGIHYVFQKFVYGVEIEMKLREKEYFQTIIHPIHQYIDESVSKEDKETITWIKYNLKGTTGYSAFKVLYYENALACIGKDVLLYAVK